MQVVTVVGARPQFVKAATLSRAIANRTDIDELLVHTGQHSDPDMSDVFFRQLGMKPPSYDLGISGGRHGEMTGRMIIALEQVFVGEQPEAVVVFGDTNSTLAAALVAAKLHLPVVHVEAGLRSFNRSMPEEVNRVLTDHLSDLSFCPTTGALNNLVAEGITVGVHHTGDLMYDACVEARRRADPATEVLARLGVGNSPYALATVHRPVNTDDPVTLRRVIRYLDAVAADMTVVLPLHPRTKLAAAKFQVSLDALSLCPPLGYLEMTSLLAGAEMVLTDSGGVQKEAYFHRVPCVTLRDETEWVETIDAGWNRLWHEATYQRPKVEIDEYGDGHAAELMADLISKFLRDH